ncbi:MAG: phytanoyl-CoA dioxygenase family protein [Fimbriimonas sp.]
MGVSPSAVKHFAENGYAIARGLFSGEEVSFLKKYFTDMVERGGDGWAEGGVDPLHADPLKRYPRLLQPHRGDQVAMDYMIDARINEWLTALLSREPLAVQTMVYFKPPGARGQALHQDNRYLKVEPGTCVAAWMALDACDEENGCLEVVPGSHKLDMVCPVPSDMSQSFTGETVPVPPGLSTTMLPLRPGDVLFFNGSLIHGSPPNRSDRFRTIIVGHYIEGDAECVSEYYFPVYRMDGTMVEVARSPDGQPCGVFVDRDGQQVFELAGTIQEAKAAH